MKAIEASKRPPLALEVVDLLNLARLAMSRADVQPLFWAFEYRGKRVLGNLFSIPYWRGSLPIFAYTGIEGELGGYVAYTSIEVEKVFFTSNSSNTRYAYGPVVELEEPPKIITRALSSKRGLREKPISIKAKNLSSLIRVLMIMSDDVASPPLWHCESEAGKHILGVITPFYDYYEANALPVFFYIESNEPPAPFIKYRPLNGGEELLYADSASDMKYFYGRVVTVKNIPFLRLRHRSRS
ncbi:MAG: hypothetical protein N3F65_01865 [Nitrososphaeria archaeon]|nr:hypothetical protein [Aigarchaeota archaeon]MCX8187340.1 hypothetical protein [Nitrososphaeria archaeon]MDW8021126.1 hypothetical protein [Nitrososphaerota archaeon]